MKKKESKSIIKIDPKEYGLEQTKAKQIEQAFSPMLKTMTELEDEFNEIVPLEMSIEKAKAARELRLKLVKVRTGTAKIHKELKDFYLAGGRFVDGWKNAQLFASQGLEEKLAEWENHYENLRLKEIERLHEEREAKLRQFDVAVIPGNLGEMEPDVFEAFLAGSKLIHDNKIAEERKRKEQEQEKQRKTDIYYQRERELLLFSNFVDFNDLTIETTQKEWNSIMKGAKDKQQAQKILNDRKLELINLGAKIDDDDIVLINKENPDHSNIVPIKDLEKLSEKRYHGFIEEFNTTSEINAQFVENLRIQNEKLQNEQKIKDIRSAQLIPFSIFIRDYDKTITLLEDEFQTELRSLQEQKHQYDESERKKADETAKAAKFAEEKRKELADLLEEEKQKKIVAENAAKVAMKQSGKLIEETKDLKTQMQEEREKQAGFLPDISTETESSVQDENSKLYDQERLSIMADELRFFKCEGLQTEKGKKILLNTQSALEKIANYIIEQSKNL